MKEKPVRIVIHSLIWGAFLLFLLLFMPFYDMGMRHTPVLFLGMYGFLIAYYYFNSNLLVPRLLTRGRFWLFALISLLLLVVYAYLTDQLDWMKPRDWTGSQGPPLGSTPPLTSEPPLSSAPPPPGAPLSGNPPPEKLMPPGESMLPGHAPFWEKILYHKIGFHFPLSATLTFLLVFIISTGTRVITYWRESERKKEQAEYEKSLAELSALKAQVNPHFLFNTLNSIYYLARKKEDSTAEMVLKLSDLMRFVLTDTNLETIAVGKEMEVIQQYIDLQKLRLTDKTEVTFVCDPVPENVRIAPLLLLPFVENAFKFGVSSTSNTLISITLTHNAPDLKFVVVNQKVHLHKIEESTGTGIRNVRQRLELIYPRDHVLDLTETELDFTVQLTLHLG